MNRDDLLQKCVDRGVADETSVEAVSHLFYVYLLSALQRGQRVEIPSFGTFGTRVVGVKRMRRIPFFDVEKDLAEKVNERFRQLKSLVIGKFELVPTLVEEEYKGKEAPFDSRQEGVGKEILLDIQREIPTEEYELAARQIHVTPPVKEKELMPKLNLKGEEMGPEGQPPEMGPEQPAAPPPTLREIPSERRMSPLVQIAVAVLIVGAVTYALNQFGIVHLWGKKAQVVEVAPSTEITPPAESEVVKPPEAEVGQESVTAPTPTPTPTPQAGIKPKPAPGATPTPTVPAERRGRPTPVPGVTAKPGITVPPAGKGDFTVQISSWASKSKANAQVASLEKEGFSAFIEEADVAGRVWHRVRIGRYPTVREASEAAAHLRSVLGDGFWVDRLK
jgi:septal ring-binding cell division protein DamX/nucleoid DNA-binding protein